MLCSCVKENRVYIQSLWTRPACDADIKTDFRETLPSVTGLSCICSKNLNSRCAKCLRRCMFNLSKRKGRIKNMSYNSIFVKCMFSLCFFAVGLKRIPPAMECFNTLLLKLRESHEREVEGKWKEYKMGPLVQTRQKKVTMELQQNETLRESF